MTTQQRSELDRAIERALRDGIVILARGTRKSDGARIWGVTSKSSHDHRLHQVVEVEYRLICDCPSRVICKHRGLVHLDLAHEHAAVKAAQLAQTRLDSQRREQSAVSYGNGAFSMWKA